MKQYTNYLGENRNNEKSESLNETYNSPYDILGPFRYFLIDEWGEDEYQNLQDAGPIAAQDGDTTINITTSAKPKDTHPDELTKVLRGWLSSYKKYDGLRESIKQRTKLVQDFAQSLLKKYPIKDLKLFYYPESSTEDVIMINLIEIDKEKKNTGIGTVVMNDITTFADNEGFILTLNPSNKFGSSIKRLREFYKRFGFVKNTDKRFTEEMIRKPNGEITESAMGFINLRPNTNSPVTFRKSIQDADYLEQWYDKFLEILNSKEYKERRYKESFGLTISKKRLGSAKVGFSIVGSSNVA